MKKPFFARFLEAQELETVQGAYHPHSPCTEKFPSDSDEHGLFTEKYPSDSDEVGPILVTMKYPSDNEECVTMKYPSDDDETDEIM